VERIRDLARLAGRPEVLGGIGAFGGFFRLGSYRDPVLVAGADGVGTKLKVAFALGRHDTVGIDCVAMNVNDVLTSGAEPLFFLDYLALGRLDPDLVEEVVRGLAAGCREAGCALLGGETAEMPGFYPPGEYDLAGFAVGVVEREELVDGSGVRSGDVCLGLPSSGLHSNGFSLVRRLIEEEGLDLEGRVEELGCPLGEELLRPTRIYVRPVLSLLREEGVRPRAMVHVTGGGIVENLPRVLPPGLEARIFPGSWPEPPVFGFLCWLAARRGGMEEQEMYRTFNLGLGFILILDPAEEARARAFFRRWGMEAYPVGEIREGEGGVKLG
jgi:phosphoribosylformylglycinamidine cyclo-ligase